MRSLMCVYSLAPSVLVRSQHDVDHPFGHHASVTDMRAHNEVDLQVSAVVKLVVTPPRISTGGTVSLSWKDAGGYTPQDNDWIGSYCRDDLSKMADADFLDRFYVTVDRNWTSGSGGVESFVILNARQAKCEFRLFTHKDGSAYNRIGTSDTVSITDIGSVATQLHLALTGDVTEMLVHWTAAASGGWVEYGPKGEAWESTQILSVPGNCHTYSRTDMCHPPATTEELFEDPGQLCEAVMIGLVPDTEYQYRVSSDGGTTYTPAAIFRAAPDVDPDYSFKYIVYADMGYWGGDAAKVTARLATQEIADGARMTHHFGDLSYAVGYAFYWDLWMQLIEPYAKAAPYMVGIGNHEWDYMVGSSVQPDISGEVNFQPSWGNFGNDCSNYNYSGVTYCGDSGGECGVPTVNRFHMPSERSRGNGVFWHSYDFGSLHTIMLSSEHDVGKGSNQFAWLATDLAAVNRSRTPWLVVELHRPLYNNEAYLGDYKVAENFQRLFEDLLVRYDVDLVLAGHYHSYLRSHRVYKDKVDDVRGIYHFTIGSAGCGIDGAGLWHKDWNAFFDDDYGYGRITIANSTAMHWEFVRNKENHDASIVVDEAWIMKRQPVVVIYV